MRRIYVVAKDGPLAKPCLDRLDIFTHGAPSPHDRYALSRDVLDEIGKRQSGNLRGAAQRYRPIVVERHRPRQPIRRYGRHRVIEMRQLFQAPFAEA